ncbi:FAD-binding protein [Lelliottia wanjuensis]|uniref:FAD-binding protein n=1 Tax=Lelliottia wanjuensis TaxID=3050585 RepID=A0AAP4FZ64_9ENTR|nr:MULTISPECIES: FAD-binding protein [unclassified Lelliottia]MDK9366222.1 FAD-binding protein [Lelliottia sp. V106_12]MDK9585059.1 FAD-binding protein [Lelliottia sp. V86_10]MDK9619446.1 FAD-binding protein [Lelliottia sp. V106_9]
MKIAMVILKPEDEGPMADFLAAHQLHPQCCWRVNGGNTEAQLPALEAAFITDSPEMVLFPSSAAGDELATRLAWRLHGSAICQVQSWNNETHTVTKAVYGSALTATLRPERRPICLSLAANLPRLNAVFPTDIPTTEMVPIEISGGLPEPEILTKSAHPLQSARVVLATGQGATGEIFEQLAAALDAEPAFTRQRVMAGGCDEQRMLGISGQSVAPEVCLIAGASGASAFMAGVAQSRFIVAINQDRDAAVFAAADVGVVGDAQEVLQALVACRV